MVFLFSLVAVTTSTVVHKHDFLAIGSDQVLKENGVFDVEATGCKALPVGTRVVRGEDWSSDDHEDQDGGEGRAGTIVKAQDASWLEGWVRVIWDQGGEGDYLMWGGTCELKIAPDRLQKEAEKDRPQKEAEVPAEKEGWCFRDTGCGDQKYCNCTHFTRKRSCKCVSKKKEGETCRFTKYCEEGLECKQKKILSLRRCRKQK